MSHRYSRRITPLDVRLIGLIAEGLTTKEMCSTEKIAQATIETYRVHVLRKFGAKNSAHLVAIAFKKRILK